MININELITGKEYWSIIGKIKDQVPTKIYFEKQIGNIEIAIKPLRNKRCELIGITFFCKGDAKRTNIQDFKFDKLILEPYEDFLYQFKQVIQPCTYDFVGIRSVNYESKLSEKGKPKGT